MSSPRRRDCHNSSEDEIDCRALYNELDAGGDVYASPIGESLVAATTAAAERRTATEAAGRLSPSAAVGGGRCVSPYDSDGRSEHRRRSDKESVQQQPGLMTRFRQKEENAHGNEVRDKCCLRSGSGRCKKHFVAGVPGTSSSSMIHTTQSTNTLRAVSPNADADSDSTSHGSGGGGGGGATSWHRTIKASPGEEHATDECGKQCRRSSRCDKNRNNYDDGDEFCFDGVSKENDAGSGGGVGGCGGGGREMLKSGSCHNLSAAHSSGGGKSSGRSGRKKNNLSRARAFSSVDIHHKVNNGSIGESLVSTHPHADDGPSSSFSLARRKFGSAEQTTLVGGVAESDDDREFRCGGGGKRDGTARLSKVKVVQSQQRNLISRKTSQLSVNFKSVMSNLFSRQKSPPAPTPPKSPFDDDGDSAGLLRPLGSNRNHILSSRLVNRQLPPLPVGERRLATAADAAAADSNALPLVFAHLAQDEEGAAAGESPPPLLTSAAVALSEEERGTTSSDDDQRMEGRNVVPPTAATTSTRHPSDGNDGGVGGESSSGVASDPLSPIDFAASIQRVKDYGWYWGPISGSAAERILSAEPDGSFLVRDSSDEHYIFSLTFKLNGFIRHVRIEHDQGNFSFGSFTKFKSRTIVDFIENAVAHSRSGRYLFFLHRRPALGPMQVQLLHPVSRFKRVQGLQHMCRFVILKSVRRDLLGRLPLPRRLIRYLNTPHYYSEDIARMEQENDDDLSNDDDDDPPADGGGRTRERNPSGDCTRERNRSGNGRDGSRFVFEPTAFVIEDRPSTSAAATVVVDVAREAADAAAAIEITALNVEYSTSSAPNIEPMSDVAEPTGAAAAAADVAREFTAATAVTPTTAAVEIEHSTSPERNERSSGPVQLLDASQSPAVADCDVTAIELPSADIASTEHNTTPGFNVTNVRVVGADTEFEKGVTCFDERSGGGDRNSPECGGSEWGESPHLPAQNDAPQQNIHAVVVSTSSVSAEPSATNHDRSVIAASCKLTQEREVNAIITPSEDCSAVEPEAVFTCVNSEESVLGLTSDKMNAVSCSSDDVATFPVASFGNSTACSSELSAVGDILICNIPPPCAAATNEAFEKQSTQVSESSAEHFGSTNGDRSKEEPSETGLRSESVVCEHSNRVTEPSGDNDIIVEDGEVMGSHSVNDSVTQSADNARQCVAMRSDNSEAGVARCDGDANRGTCSESNETHTERNLAREGDMKHSESPEMHTERNADRGGEAPLSGSEEMHTERNVSGVGESEHSGSGETHRERNEEETNEQNSEEEEEGSRGSENERALRSAQQLLVRSYIFDDSTILDDESFV